MKPIKFLSSDSSRSYVGLNELLSMQKLRFIEYRWMFDRMQKRNELSNFSFVQMNTDISWT